MVGVCVLVPVEVGSLSHTQSLLTRWSHQPACTGHPLPPLAEAGITVAPSIYMGSGHPNSGFLVVCSCCGQQDSKDGVCGQEWWMRPEKQHPRSEVHDLPGQVRLEFTYSEVESLLEILIRRV